MVVPDWHVLFLKQPLSFWLATTSIENIPEPIKCTGIRFDPSTDMFLCFAPEVFAKPALEKLSIGSTMALVGVELHTYEGYQYKGPYVSYRNCTEEEVAFQKAYMKEFTAILGAFGYSAAGYMRAYFREPLVAVTLQALQVFDQSPKIGTGGEIRTGVAQV